MSRIIMLPTDKESEIGFRNGYIISRFGEPFTQAGNANPHHLYLLSDDKIEDKDWYYNTEMKTSTYGIHQCDERLVQIGINDDKRYRKIIVTTDKSLELPLFTEEYIKEYIEQYNKTVH